MFKDFISSERKISRAILYIFNRKYIRKFIPDSIYIRFRYYFQTGHVLSLNNPQTFNEKLQWLKIYNRNEYYTKLVDKYEVKAYIKRKVGEKYVIPTLGVWFDPDEIDFKKLPDRFVLKCTHDSGGVLICKNKEDLNISQIKQILKTGLMRDQYKWTCEWPYKNVLRRIIAEEYLSDNQDDNEGLSDYKFFCFNGVVKCFKIDFDRFSNHRANYYDNNCNLLPFGEVACPPDFEKFIKLPENIHEMILLAEKLSEGFPFIRIDLYNSNGRIFFGEMTFFPASGFGKFTDQKWDNILGEWLNLPNR